MYALLLLNLIIPFVMILVGKLLQAHPVKDMSTHNGYNTPTSRKSQEHWDYAQEIAPNIFVATGIKSGVAETILSILLFILQLPVGSSVAVGMAVGICFLFWGFYKTETKIKEHFPQN